MSNKSDTEMNVRSNSQYYEYNKKIENTIKDLKSNLSTYTGLNLVDLSIDSINEKWVIVSRFDPLAVGDYVIMLDKNLSLSTQIKPTFVLHWIWYDLWLYDSFWTWTIKKQTFDFLSHDEFDQETKKIWEKKLQNNWYQWDDFQKRWEEQKEFWHKITSIKSWLTSLVKLDS